MPFNLPVIVTFPLLEETDLAFSIEASLPVLYLYAYWNLEKAMFFAVCGLKL